MHKFELGDLVEVGKLHPNMGHFDQECLAIVTGSYTDLCGGSKRKGPYQLMILPMGFAVAWYDEKDLTLIKESYARWHHHVAHSAGLAVNP